MTTAGPPHTISVGARVSRWRFLSLLALCFISAAGGSAGPARDGRGRAAGPAEREADRLLVGMVYGCSGVSLSFSSDGERFITSDGDSARVWMSRSLHPDTEPLVHPKLDVAILTTDGRKVITRGGMEVRIWDARTGRRLLV